MDNHQSLESPFDPVSSYLATNPIDDLSNSDNTDTETNTTDTNQPCNFVCPNNNNHSHCPCYSLQEKRIKKLQKKLKTAAELGQALLARHQKYVASAEHEKAEMLYDISQLKEQLRTIDLENEKLLNENSQLAKQLSFVSDSLYVSDQKVEKLSESLNTQKSLIIQVNGYAARTDALEEQIILLESMRENLEQEVQLSARDKRQAEMRWRKTEQLLDKLTLQYQQLEEEAAQNQIIIPAQTDSASVLNTTTPTKKQDDTPLKGFIKTLVVENKDLESKSTDLQLELESARRENQLLKQQLALSAINPPNSLTIVQPQLHTSSDSANQQLYLHHHHFHTVSQSSIISQSTPARKHNNITEIFDTPIHLIGGIPTPPESMKKDDSQIASSSKQITEAETAADSTFNDTTLAAESSPIPTKRPKRRRRRHSFQQGPSSNDESDSCFSDTESQIENTHYYNHFPIHTSERAIIRKFTSHESGLRHNIMPKASSSTLICMPESPEMAPEELDFNKSASVSPKSFAPLTASKPLSCLTPIVTTDNMSSSYQPPQLVSAMTSCDSRLSDELSSQSYSTTNSSYATSPKLYRSTSHESIFSLEHTSSLPPLMSQLNLNEQQPPAQLLTFDPFSKPDFEKHKPAVISKSSGISKLARVSAEFKGTTVNSNSSSKALLSAAVANSARKTSLGKTTLATSSSFSSGGSWSFLPKKWRQNSDNQQEESTDATDKKNGSTNAKESKIIPPKFQSNNKQGLRSVSSPIPFNTSQAKAGTNIRGGIMEEPTSNNRKANMDSIFSTSPCIPVVIPSSTSPRPSLSKTFAVASPAIFSSSVKNNFDGTSFIDHAQTSDYNESTTTTFTTTTSKTLSSKPSISDIVSQSKQMAKDAITERNPHLKVKHFASSERLSLHYKYHMQMNANKQSESIDNESFDKTESNNSNINDGRVSPNSIIQSSQEFDRICLTQSPYPIL